MDREVLTCQLCKFVLWDPIVISCCKSPFCFSCVQELEQAKETLRCVVCHKDWSFSKEATIDGKGVQIDLQNVKVIRKPSFC